MFFIRVCFSIAVLIVLDSSSSLADSYLRVNQRGVICYYFNDRHTGNPDVSRVNQSRENSPVLQKVVPSPGPAHRLNLPLASIILPKQFINPSLDVRALPSQPEMLTDAVDLFSGENQSDGQETMRTAKYGILKILTRLNFFNFPNMICNENEELPDKDFLVPDVWAKVPKYFQAALQNQKLCSGSGITLPLVGMPTLPKYACQPRLWGRVDSGGSLKPSSSQYYCFPVGHSFNFRDSWGDPRANGRIHHATDVFAPEGTELYAITSGVIHGMSTSSTGGIMLWIAGNDGHGYAYMHLQAYADGITVGKTVRAGELVGYCGRTGTQTSPAHLHIQVYPDHNFCHENLVNPYDFLVQLCRGTGVTDFNQPKVARRTENNLKLTRPFDIMGKNKNSKIKWIQVYQRPFPKGFGEHTLKLDYKGSPVLTIRNN